MERRYINSLKEKLADILIQNKETERAIEIMAAPTYSPVLKKVEAHAEAEPNILDINTMFSEIIYDLSILNTELAIMGNSTRELMENTNSRLKSVVSTLNTEKERQKDIKMLCNKYSEFNTVLDLSEEYFDGNFSVNEGIFSAEIINQSTVPFRIVSIEGNGYEGNSFVYKDDDFLENKIYTGNRRFINDDSKITVYEYSRLTASNAEKNIFSKVNSDSVEAKCIMTLASDISFNTALIGSNSKKINLLDVQVSKNGVEFNSVIKQSIAFNDINKKYEVFNYIAGSGVICFPDTNFLRLVFESDGYTDDVIAFEKTIVKGLD